MFVSESVVKAVARYLEGEGQDGGDIAMNYASSDVDGDEQLGRNAGIVVLTKNGMSPAKLSIVRSTVTAEGDTAAILVCATSEDGSVAGTIELEGSIIQTPAPAHERGETRETGGEHAGKGGVARLGDRGAGDRGLASRSLRHVRATRGRGAGRGRHRHFLRHDDRTLGNVRTVQRSNRLTRETDGLANVILNNVIPTLIFGVIVAHVTGLFVSRKRG